MAHDQIKNIVITLEHCEKKLNKGERKYNKEEIRQIRDYLYFIGQIETDNNKN